MLARMTQATPHDEASALALQDADYDALEAILDDLRSREDETPQWEFCDGFLTALVCCRRAIGASEWLPVLLGVDGQDDAAGDGARFASAGQRTQWLMLCQQRMAQVRAALQAPVESLEDERALLPDMMDVRGALAALSPAERAEAGVDEHDPVPAFGQVWALGFVYAVESWPDEWAPPRDRDDARVLDEALSAIVALTEDDAGPITIPAGDDDGAPSMSQQRLDQYALAIWAVYELFELWQQLGPRVATVRHPGPQPGRNDPCPCGSGKKFKKCCGA